MKFGGNCTTIAPEKPFLNLLATWVLERYGADATQLTRTLILLPNRRACRALREAFLDVTGGKPILLPRIQPIGDIDEEVAFPHYAPENAAIPPAISIIRRELLLTRLVMHFTRNRRYNVEQAAELARQLALFIDDVAREGLDFSRLAALAPEELAQHWQETLNFLSVISHHWPDIIREEQSVDPALHRNLQLAAVAEAWRVHPPAHPVIAAGSTGNTPATAQLLKTIAHLPQGMLVLPGLDKAMSESEWNMVSETHPQFGLKQLLEALECKRDDVPYLDGANPQNTRESCLRTILQPPEATSGWTHTVLPLEGLDGVSLLTADTLLDEARMIAIALRETLETPKKTAALVTPDRQLARMVAAQMQRFGIDIDDSAGQKLKNSPTGCFLRLAIDMVATQAAPSPLLALLRHPFAAAGMATAQCRALSRTLETELLRGIRHTPGLDSLCAAASRFKSLHRLLEQLAIYARPLAALFEERAPVSLRRLLEAHMAFAEWLATTEDTQGASVLWAGEAGNAMASFLAELLQHADLLDAIDPLSYPELFETLLVEQAYRPRFGLHPRLHILSPIEARLQHFDRVILGSLNEGTWPQSLEADPWMSRPMRIAFGLNAPERSVGQSAHDVSLLCAAPEVFLTRARKVEGTPTVPSRWLVRLATLVAGLDAQYYAKMQVEKRYEQGVKLIDAPAPMMALAKPEPTPPLEARPRQLRVTAIDTWLRDPYMLYAQYILKLRRLEPLDQEPDAADFGNIVHKAFEQFTLLWPQALPDNALASLIECGRDVFAPFMDRPAVVSLWWPRFEGMAAWFIEQEIARRGSVAYVMSEIKGEWQLDNGFTLTTRIDRLEIGHDGALTLIDYKTGTVPAKADLERGLANQLPLEALIALCGSLTPALALAGNGNVSALEYWKLAGNPDSCEVKSIGTEWMEQTHMRLEELIQRFNNAATPYTAQSDPTLLARYNDYEHLTRRQEWEAI